MGSYRIQNRVTTPKRRWCFLKITYFCPEMENKDSLLGILGTLYKWRNPLIILCAAAGIGTAAISLYMPNYYKATTTFFAASPDQTKPELIFNRSMSLRMEYYGNANDIDRLLTIAESSELLAFLVDSFNLYQHYQIDSNAHKASHVMRETFFSLYEVKKTKRDAIELSIEDKDPQIAARIANAARNKIEDIARRLIQTSQEQTIAAYQNNIDLKERLLLAIGDSLATLRTQYGTYNVVAQTQSLTEQRSEALALFTRDSVRLQVLRANAKVPRDTVYLLEGRVAGLRQEVKVLQTQIDRLNSGVATIYNLEKQYAEANQILGEDRERLKQWQAAYRSEAPTVLLLESAEPPVIKSRPKRSIIVLAAACAAFLFGVIGVLLIDTYKSLDWRQVLNPGENHPTT